jgi:hypothetical protein
MAETTAKRTTTTAKDAGTDAGAKGTTVTTYEDAKAKGYFGHTPDETPNRNYTLQGVIEGAATPETAAEGR